MVRCCVPLKSASAEQHEITIQEVLLNIFVSISWYHTICFLGQKKCFSYFWCVACVCAHMTFQQKQCSYVNVISDEKSEH